MSDYSKKAAKSIADYFRKGKGDGEDDEKEMKKAALAKMLGGSLSDRISSGLKKRRGK